MAGVEAAVFGAGLAHLRRTVALGEHHHRAARGLELIDEGIHPPRRRRPEGARGVTRRGLRGAGVVDGMVLEVIAHRLATVEPLADLGVRGVAGDDHRAGQRQTRADGMSAQLGEDLFHRPGEIDAHHRTAEFRFVHDGQEMGGVVLQLLEEDALAGDLSQRLPVRRAGDPEADRQRGAMPGKPDHAHVVAEIFAAELRADAELLRELMNFLLEREIAKRMSVGPSRSGERVEIFRRGELHRLQRQLRARAADDDRQVIGRAGRGAEGENLFLQERDQAIVGQDRRRRPIEEALVGGAAALALLTLGRFVEANDAFARLYESIDKAGFRALLTAVEVPKWAAVAAVGRVREAITGLEGAIALFVKWRNSRLVAWAHLMLGDLHKIMHEMPTPPLSAALRDPNLAFIFMTARGRARRHYERAALIARGH